MLQNLCCSWCSFMTIGYQPIDSFLLRHTLPMSGLLGSGVLLPVQHSVFPLPAIVSSIKLMLRPIHLHSFHFPKYSMPSLHLWPMPSGPLHQWQVRPWVATRLDVSARVSAPPSNAQLSLRYPQQHGFSTLPGGIFDIPTKKNTRNGWMAGWLQFKLSTSIKTLIIDTVWFNMQSANNIFESWPISTILGMKSRVIPNNT